MGTQLTEAEKALLSPEELAGLEDEDVVDSVATLDEEQEDAPGGRAPSADDEESELAKADREMLAALDDETKGRTRDDELDEQLTELIKKDAPPATVEKSEDDADETAVAVETAEPLFPKFEAVEDYEGKKAALDAKRTELDQKFDDGELTNVEYRAQDRALTKEEMQLDQAQNNFLLSESARKDLEKQQITTWGEKTVPAWLAKNPQYQEEDNALLLDAEVRRLQAAQTTNGAKMQASILDQAHKNIIARARKLAGVKDEETPPSPANVKKEPRQPVPTLAHVPAADVPEATDGGRYAALDRLAQKDPLAFERQLERMEKNDPAGFADYMAR